ncbi:MAG TPA: hypothetical protein VM869_31385, partial [Enhygromyxa sp.]|nr:hypothetical protein [Enhygromyxa sp.]
LESIPRLDQHVIVEGEVEQIGRLRERGTLIVTPTHSSNLDSLVIGFAVHDLIPAGARGLHVDRGLVGRGR